MRIAVIGAGAVGGYFGGRLAASGQDVVFIARGQTLSALTQQGLAVESVLGDFSLPKITATNRPSEVGPVDVIIVAVKAWQVPEVAPTLGPLLGPETTVLPLQNGVEAPAELGRALGANHVLGGLCKIIAFAKDPGRIKHTGATPLVILGELDGRASERVERLHRALLDAGIAAEASLDIQDRMWEKLLFISAFGGVGAITRAPIGVMRSLEETRRLLERSMTETRSVASAGGIELPEDVIKRNMAYLDALPAEATSSMQRDVAMGRPSELEALNGAISRIGAELFVETPLHSCIYASLLPGERRARGLLSF